MEQHLTTKHKIYFLYFIIATIFVLGIFAYLIFSYYWGYRQEIKDMEKYYKEKFENLSKETPQINRFDPTKGDPGATVTLFIYSDFTCAECKNLQANITELENLYGNNLRFVYKLLPITSHPSAASSANAAYCAWEQNDFWNYKDLLYQNSDYLVDQTYQELAIAENLNMDQFNQCLKDNKYLPVLQQNLADALSLQITAIPALVINNQKVEGFINTNTIKNIIDKKLME